MLDRISLLLGPHGTPFNSRQKDAHGRRLQTLTMAGSRTMSSLRYLDPAVMGHHGAMRIRICLPVVFVALVVQAGTQLDMNIDQLKQMVTSSIALKHDDKTVAEYLKHVHLTERLNDEAIEQLISMGVGARTIKALQELRDQSEKLAPKIPPATKQDQPSVVLSQEHTPTPIPAPDSVRQAQILDLFRDYAKNYTKGLPNFLCLQVTDRYIYSPRDGRDRKIDRIVAQLSYIEGQERYKVVSQNNQYIDSPMDHIRGGSISTGEFGSMMAKLFESSSQAQFEWEKWGTLRGKRVAVFMYKIDSGHSSYSISYDDQQRIITAYQGEIFGDPDTGIVSRIKFEAIDIPSSFPVQEATDVLDYGEVDIGGSPHICPLKAELHMRAGSQQTRNDIAFRLYRVFGADSVIKYNTEDLEDKKAPPGDEKPGTTIPPPPPPNK